MVKIRISSVYRIASEHPYLVWASATVVIVGASCIIVRLQKSGLVANLPLWITLSLLFITQVFLIATLAMMPGSAPRRAFRICSSIIAVVVALPMILGWTLTFGEKLPDPGIYYFRWTRDRILAHAEIDPVTQVKYYPLHYTDTRTALGKIPSAFYLFDSDPNMFVRQYSGRQVLPLCLNSFNSDFTYTEVERGVYYIVLAVSGSIAATCDVANGRKSG